MDCLVITFRKCKKRRSSSSRDSIIMDWYFIILEYDRRCRCKVIYYCCCQDIMLYLSWKSKVYWNLYKVYINLSQRKILQRLLYIFNNVIIYNVHWRFFIRLKNKSRDCRITCSNENIDLVFLWKWYLSIIHFESILIFEY